MLKLAAVHAGLQLQCCYTPHGLL